MAQLEFCYQTPLKTAKFLSRKHFISAPKTLIIGSKGSGKTALLCDYLAQFKQSERLYLSLEDMRLDQTQIIKNLSEFLQKNDGIKIIAIDDASASVIDELSRLNTPNIIISTSDQTTILQGFAILNLPYLDYEEFIAFFRKNLDPEMIFSHFLAHANSPKAAFIDATEVAEMLQNDLRASLDPTSIAILKTIAPKIGEPISAYEIFKTLKEHIRVSKDSIYALFAQLERHGYIATIRKFNEPNVGKKIYFKNFGLRNALSAKKDFTQIFVNVVFCELAKFKEEIFYTKELDFFLSKRKLAIICVPFSANEIVFLKFKKLHAKLKELGVLRLQVISVANSGEMAIEGVKCEIVPFSRWALGF